MELAGFQVIAASFYGMHVKALGGCRASGVTGSKLLKPQKPKASMEFRQLGARRIGVWCFSGL